MGIVFDAITGPLMYNFEEWKIAPRTLDDFVGGGGLTAEPYTIPQIQGGDVPVTSLVIVEEVVVTSPPTFEGDMFFVMDPAGGEYSGIAVFLYDPTGLQVRPGDRITLNGAYQEYFEQSQLVLESVADLEVLGTVRLQEDVQLTESKPEGVLMPSPEIEEPGQQVKAVCVIDDIRRKQLLIDPHGPLGERLEDRKPQCSGARVAERDDRVQDASYRERIGAVFLLGQGELCAAEPLRLIVFSLVAQPDDLIQGIALALFGRAIDANRGDAAHQDHQDDEQVAPHPPTSKG